ncbi:TetR/AcrR family transcriptional regulator [Jiulongibacter sp. NS-SX5]|uniref:TetR/AcrR family transcriptional regulator n=1 Tax=Jiulongibacter sp. NS-SX5 TaxID=3463854 RepID=UPI004057CFF9
METKERIVEKSIELFFSRGIRSVTMDDIASELGISKKTIYQHFSDKTTLVYEVSKSFLSEEKCREQEIARKSSDPIDEVILHSRVMREIFLKINPGVLYDLQKYYPKAWKLYKEHKTYFRKSLEDNIRKGMEKGYYRSEIDPSILSFLRINAVEWAFSPEAMPNGNGNILKVQMEFMDHFIRGIVTEKGLKAYEATKN